MRLTKIDAVEPEAESAQVSAKHVFIPVSISFWKKKCCIDKIITSFHTGSNAKCNWIF